MTAGTLESFWFPLLALLAVEVGGIAALVEVLRRWSRSAGWRRTFCQAGLVAVLVLSAGELSGAARLIAGRLVGPRSRLPAAPLALETAPAQLDARWYHDAESGGTRRTPNASRIRDPQPDSRSAWSARHARAFLVEDPVPAATIPVEIGRPAASTTPPRARNCPRVSGCSWFGGRARWWLGDGSAWRGACSFCSDCGAARWRTQPWWGGWSGWRGRWGCGDGCG